MTNNRQTLSVGLAAVFLLALVATDALPDAPAQPAAPAAPGADNAEAAPDLSPLREPLEKLEKAVHHYGGNLGLSIVDLRTGRIVLAKNAAEARNPASNAKLVTMWAALKTLGPDHRYLTGLYGHIRDGRVERLVLRGEGDPSFEHDQLYAMVSELRRQGVAKVVDILVDQSRFDDQHVPPAYEQQPNEWSSFRAPVAAVSLDGNAVMLGVYPTKPGDHAHIRSVPPSIVDVDGEVATVDEGKAETVHVDVSALPGGRLRATFGGSIPVDSPPVRIWRRVDDPAALAGHALADICRELGIKVVGKVTRGHPYQVEDLLASHRSEPLGKLLHALGKDSDNFHAEMIFKSLGGENGPASYEAARARVNKLLDAAQLDASTLRLDNGSGLFDADRMAPEFVTNLLAAAARDPAVAPELVSELAIGGVDGTLRDRFEGFRETRTVRAKSGTLSAVSSLSGYVLGSDGKPAVAFSVLVDNVKGASVLVRYEIDGLIATLAATTR